MYISIQKISPKHLQNLLKKDQKLLQKSLLLLISKAKRPEKSSLNHFKGLLAPLLPFTFELFKEGGGQPKFIANKENSPLFSCSVSHTKDFYAFLLAQNEASGIDVEAVERKVSLTVANYYFAEEEKHYLASCSADQAQSTFLRLWTLKEALGKAMGTGINRSVLSINLLDALKTDFFSVQFVEHETYHIGHLPIDPNFYISIALKSTQTLKKVWVVEES